MKRLLILGGTGEATALHDALAQDFGDEGLEVVSSLAGRTAAPRMPSGKVRRGGFGGAGGLARWLREHEIDMVVDATHPYAVQISANAHAACTMAGVERVLLWRQPWTPQPGDNWINVPDAATAAEILPSVGRRAFLALGVGELSLFRDVPGVWLMSRVAERPDPQSPAPGLVIVARGPFDAEAELRLLREQAIDVLVSRNSGGDATVGKIAAARELGIPVVMIDRPPREAGQRFSEVKEVLQWVSERMDP
jgi:precorrin-6A/cobalt-precorrin-6A reductase